MRKLLCALVLVLCIAPSTAAEQDLKRLGEIACFLATTNSRMWIEVMSLEVSLDEGGPDAVQDGSNEYIDLTIIRARTRMAAITFDSLSVVAERELESVKQGTRSDKQRDANLYQLRTVRAIAIRNGHDALENINRQLTGLRKPALAVATRKIRDYIQAAIEKLDAWNP